LSGAPLIIDVIITYIFFYVYESLGDRLGALVQVHSSFECGARLDSWCPHLSPFHFCLAPASFDRIYEFFAPPLRPVAAQR
jgi:hypothetical protein